MFKGLIIDRCVLLTPTPQCVVSPRRAITRAQPSSRGETTHEGVDVNKTHPSMINPDYNMMPKISILIYQYSAYQKRIKAYIESNRSPCCHVTTHSWWQASLSPPPPWLRKCTRQFFCGKQSVLIELHQSGVIAWRQRRRWCGVFKNWIPVAHCPFQRQWRVLHNYDIRTWTGRYVFQWDRLLEQALVFVQVGVPSCSDDMTQRSCIFAHQDARTCATNAVVQLSQLIPVLVTSCVCWSPCTLSDDPMALCYDLSF